MKIVKLILSSFTFFLAFLTIIICIGSIACKFIDLPENSFIQIVGYVAGSRTFKVSFPTMRLDYLFHSQDIVPKRSEVVNVRPPLSDHFPIRAEFLIPKTKPQAIR